MKNEELVRFAITNGKKTETDKDGFIPGQDRTTKPKGYKRKYSYARQTVELDGIPYVFDMYVYEQPTDAEKAAIKKARRLAKLKAELAALEGQVNA
jgi:hypothetical protein